MLYSRVELLVRVGRRELAENPVQRAWMDQVRASRNLAEQISILQDVDLGIQFLFRHFRPHKRCLHIGGTGDGVDSLLFDQELHLALIAFASQAPHHHSDQR